jgi:hypothetical protein
VHDAQAQESNASAAGCTAWQTGAMYYTSNTDLALDSPANIPQNQALAVNAVPAGWEPIGMDPISYTTSQVGIVVYMRQCTAH